MISKQVMCDMIKSRCCRKEACIVIKKRQEESNLMYAPFLRIKHCENILRIVNGLVMDG